MFRTAFCVAVLPGVLARRTSTRWEDRHHSVREFSSQDSGLNLPNGSKAVILYTIV